MSGEPARVLALLLDRQPIRPEVLASLPSPWAELARAADDDGQDPQGAFESALDHLPADEAGGIRAAVGEEFRKLLQQEAPSGAAGPQLRQLADVAPEAVRWLWHPYIPIGKLTLLEGDPGVGKSWLSLALATAVSLGHGLPGTEPAAPAPVVLLTAEDGLADTVRPRLDAMGADVARVFALEGALTLSGDGLTVLQAAVAEVRPALVVVDPIVAYLGGHVDIHRANEVRALLAPLAALAEQYGYAIVAIRHLTKGGREHAVYRGLGSIDFAAAARSMLLAGYDPDDQHKRALVQIKSNLAPLGPALGYSLAEGEFLWTGGSDLTAARILGAGFGDEGSGDALGEAENFLRAVLAEGPRPADEVLREGRSAGISERTLRRAKAGLGVKASRQNEAGSKRGSGSWLWALSDVQGCQP